MHPRTTSSRPRHLRRRLTAGLAGAAIAAGALVFATAAPASATNEFPPIPHAAFQLQCGSHTASVATILSNTGLSGADFTITATGEADVTDYVAPGDTHVLHTNDLVDDQSFTITATSGNFVANETFTPNCVSYEGTIVQTCNGNQPVLTATVHRTGVSTDAVTFSNGTTSEVQPDVDADTTFTSNVVEGLAFDAALSDTTTTFATLSGTPHCTPPVIETTTTTSTTTPETTASTVIPDTTTNSTSTTVLATTTLPDPPAQVLGQTTFPQRQVELPRTGSDTPLLALIGMTLLGIGVLLRRYAHLNAP